MSLKLPEKTVPYVVYVILFITPFLVYWPLWIHPQAMAYDMADYFLPCRHFIGECLQQGQFPWWNPYSGLGTPIAADPQSGAFYPITWIIGYFLGYDFFTINLDYLFHLAIAGWGMYTLLRGLHYPVVVCLLLAWSYQFCGFFVNNAQHFSWIISATWMPFFFHYYRQTFLKGNLPDAIRTALSLFMITTGGYPAFLIILIYLVGGHCLFFLTRNLMLKKNTEVFQWLKWSAIVLCIYLLITAPFILSFLQGVPLMTRGEALVKDHTLFRAFTPQSIITFLLPAVPLGQPEAFNTDTSMDSAYIGLVGILFFLTGALLNKTPVMRIILFLSLLILLVAFGDALPLWTFLFDTVPLLDHIRFPAAFRLFVIIGFILIAAEGMRKERVFPSKLPARIGAILIILLLIASVAAYATLPKILLPDDFSTAGLLKFFGESTVANNIVLQSVLQILLLAAILILLFYQRWQSANWYFLLLGIVVADLFIAARINFTVIMSSPFAANELNVKIVQSGDGFPMWDAATTKEGTNIGNGSFAPSYFNNNLFTKQFSSDSYIPFVLKLRSRLEKSVDKHALLDHPVIYLTKQVQLCNDSLLERTQLKNSAAVLVPDSIFNHFKTTGNDSLKATLQLTDFTASRFMIRAAVDQQAILVLQQTYYPGWKAKVDGNIIDPFIVNFCMMSVLLNAGQHEVTFYYDPGAMHWILILSTSLLLLCVGFLFLRAIKSIRAKA